MGVALELRHHLARDELVRALRRRRIGPVVREQEIRAEPAIRLLPQPLDLRGAGVRRADGAETGAVDELDHLADRVADHSHLRKRCDLLEVAEPVLDAVLDVAIRLLLGFCDMAQTDEPPLAAVRGLAVSLRFCRQHVPVQRQRVEAGGGGGPDREHAGTMPASELRAGRRGDRRDRHVEQRIGVGAQMQPRVAQIPAIVLERDRLVAGEKLRDDAHPVFQQPAGLALLQADHDAVGRQRARTETEHGTPLSQMVEQHDAFGHPQRIVIGTLMTPVPSLM